MTTGDRSVRATMLPTRHAAESRSRRLPGRFAKHLSLTRLYAGETAVASCRPLGVVKMLLSPRHERKCTGSLPEYCVR